MLAEPLQPRFSRQYFTGRPAASLVQSQTTARKISSNATANTTDSKHEVASQSGGVVSNAVALAKELAGSRKAIAQVCTCCYGDMLQAAFTLVWHKLCCRVQ